MNINFQLSAVKNYFFGFVTSGAILFSSIVYFNHSKKNADFNENAVNIEYSKADKIIYKNFDPNQFSEEDWKSIGFTDRQTATILKYKAVVGGKFCSKEQLKNCYAISEEKFAAIEPYLLLPDHANSSFSKKVNYNSSKSFTEFSNRNSYYSKKGLTIPGKFNPDNFSAEDFVKMGFSENQATSILKYKNYLGGSFISKEKFKACFIISPENYKKLEPFLLLPEKTPENFSSSKNYSATTFKPAKQTIHYQNFDPNITNLEDWVNFGFSEKQAQVIINYRDRNLNGSFKTLEDLERCFVISTEKFQELKPFVVLNVETMKSPPKNSKISNSNSTPPQTPTDFSKINLNEISFKQLLEFGFDEKAAGSFIGFRNKLGGFVNKNQILETYNIDKDLTQKLLNIAPLYTDQVQKYSLIEAPESWLKNHPYFKYYADKIIYYRITYSNEDKFFRTMKVKPEYEAKMRLYLK